MKATRTQFERFTSVKFGGAHPAEGVEREGGDEMVEQYERAFCREFGDKSNCTYYI